MRSVASEFVSVVVILSLPIAIVAAFPFGAFGFRAEDGGRKPVRTSFVRLTPEAERIALRTARTSWQEKGNGVRQLQADLFCAELPEDRLTSVLSVRDRCSPPSPPAFPCEWTPFLPSQRAAPPAQIKVVPVEVPLAFPREELLKMN